jgi:hypothetical protein
MVPSSVPGNCQVVVLGLNSAFQNCWIEWVQLVEPVAFLRVWTAFTV